VDFALFRDFCADMICLHHAACNLIYTLQVPDGKSLVRYFL
jgi:hypothetical protein